MSSPSSSPSPKQDFSKELRAALENEMLVPVIGAGVSAAAAGTPNWRQLIADGISHVEKTLVATPDDVSRARSLLDQNSLPEAAEQLKQLLGAPGGEFPAWLLGVSASRRRRPRRGAGGGALALSVYRPRR